MALYIYIYIYIYIYCHARHPVAVISVHIRGDDRLSVICWRRGHDPTAHPAAPSLWTEMAPSPVDRDECRKFIFSKQICRSINAFCKKCNKVHTHTHTHTRINDLCDGDIQTLLQLYIITATGSRDERCLKTVTGRFGDI